MAKKGSLTFLGLAKKILSEEKRPLTVDEIWEIGQKKNYDSLTGTTGKTPSYTLGALLYVDSKNNPNTIFARVGKRPVRFFLKEWGKTEVILTEPKEVKRKVSESVQYKEKHLRPFLSYFAYTRLSAYTKVIRHETSKKRRRKENEWLHPDMVGCYLPIEDWEDSVLDVARKVNQPVVKLFSFELKRRVEFANLREAFFQAVSNSSWATEGYLVVAELPEGLEFRDELKRLSNAFGIGVIHLNLYDPDSSTVVFPAATKPVLDITTINVLAELNRDFKEFLARVSNDSETKEYRKEKYEKIPENSEELVREFKIAIKKD